MEFHTMIISQYHAALEMLKQSILACPPALWSSADARTPFWKVAYHALFFTHLYLQDTAGAFRPWARHREEYQLDSQLGAVEPPDKELVLEYLAFCQRQAAERLAAADLEAASGFEWLPISKFELQLYSIRHIQQHVGELMERLGAHAQIDVGWVGTYRADAGG